jgi:hypothetical protein
VSHEPKFKGLKGLDKFGTSEQPKHAYDTVTPRPSTWVQNAKCKWLSQHDNSEIPTHVTTNQRLKIGQKTATQLQEERERQNREAHTKVHLENLELLNAIRDS